MTNKADHEIEVFFEFARVSGIEIEEGSVETRNPPEPDIHCRVAGVTCYFELGRLLDREIPKLVLEMCRKHPDPVPVDVTKFGLPERDVLRAKLSKTYKTNNNSVDLVLYYDWGSDAFLTHSALPLMDLTPEFIQAVIMSELAHGRGPFDNIWIYERIRPSVLWKYP